MTETINFLMECVKEDGKPEPGRAPLMKAVYRDASPANSMNSDRTRWYAYRKEAEEIIANEMKYRKAKPDVDTSARLAAGDPKLKIAQVVKRYKKRIKKAETLKNKATRRADKELYQDAINQYIHEAMEQIDMIEGKK